MREPTEQGAVYARVSSPDQRADLDRQVAQVVAWANAQSLAIGQG
jgi:predicted site-specific integrase-resolvase